MRRRGFLAVACLLGTVSGCSLMRPIDFRSSGTIAEQQVDAHQFDPYVDNQTGPPVVGGRPRGFDIPPSPSYQGRWRTIGGSWWDRRGF